MGRDSKYVIFIYPSLTYQKAISTFYIYKKKLDNTKRILILNRKIKITKILSLNKK